MANSTDLKLVSGMGKLSQLLKDLPLAVRERVLLAATDAAIQPIKTWAKRFAKRSERTGALRNSIIAKTKSYAGGLVVVGLVGPDRNYYVRGAKLTVRNGLLRGATSSGVSRPANYAHLIEYGHHTVASIKGTTRRKKTAIPTRSGTTWVQPKPFLRPAVLQSRTEQIAAFERSASRGLQREIKALTRS